MSKTITFLNIAAVAVAISLVAFSGTISACGLTKFLPGATVAVIVMSALLECAKLLGFALLHRPIPRAIKAALLTVSLLLMCLNIAGVAGYLSSAYEGQQIAAKAAAHTAIGTARASASVIERQLAAAESNLAAARTAVIRARDDRQRVRAANAVIATATTERDALARQLSAAQASTARVEGETISAGGEFAAVTFLARLFDVDQDRVVHLIIAGIAALPDVLAALLVTAIGFSFLKKSQSVAGPKVGTSELANPATQKPVRAIVRQPNRSRAGKRAWATRRKRALIAAQQRGLVQVKK